MLNFIVPTTMMIMIMIMVIMMVDIPVCHGSDAEEVLQRYLLKNYNPLMRPLKNRHDKVTVEFGLTFHQLIGVYEKEQILKTNFWLDVYWKDDHLKWDPAQFSGLTSIRFSRDYIWYPDIVLLNNADGNYDVTFASNLIIFNTGLVQWVPPTIYKSSCTLDVRYFPFDQHTCKLRFGSFTYNTDEISLAFYQNKDYIILSDFAESRSWTIFNCPGYIRYTQNKTKQEIVFDIRIRRRSLFYVINLIIPIIFISCITVSMFYLPLDDRERITFSISNLLSINVFLLLVSKILPPTSLLPYISKYFLLIFLVNVIAIFGTVININLRYRTRETHDMRPLFKRLVLHWLPWLLRIKIPVSGANDNNNNNNDDDSKLVPLPAMLGRLDRLLSLGKDFDKNSIAMERLTRKSGGKRVDNEFDAELASLCEKMKDIDQVKWMVENFEDEAIRRKVMDEWRSAAFVMDRLFLYIFFIVTVVGTLAIAFSIP